MRFFIALYLVCSSLFADHLPEDKIARGEPEHRLSDLSVAWAPFADAIEKLGPPQKSFNGETKEGCDSTYEYMVDKVRMEIATGCTGPNTQRREGIYCIEIWGQAPNGRIGVTGRGLALGSTLADLKRIYGSRMVVETNGRTKTIYAILQWQDDTTLTIDFDRNRRVVHMQLLTSVE